jgi:hypothetical protein
MVCSYVKLSSEGRLICKEPHGCSEYCGTYYDDESFHYCTVFKIAFELEQVNMKNKELNEYINSLEGKLVRFEK